MSNVISLVERRENWHLAYEQGSLKIYLSNHGRFKVVSGATEETLSFFDSVSLLKELSEDFERVMCTMYKDVC